MIRPDLSIRFGATGYNQSCDPHETFPHVRSVRVRYLSFISPPLRSDFRRPRHDAEQQARRTNAFAVTVDAVSSSVYVVRSRCCRHPRQSSHPPIVRHASRLRIRRQVGRSENLENRGKSRVVETQRPDPDITTTLSTPPCWSRNNNIVNLRHKENIRCNERNLRFLKNLTA